MKKNRRLQRSQARNSGPAPTGSQQPVVGMRLNKYLAHAGVASRRQCGDLVKAGKVLVNGAVQDNPGYQLQEGDTVSYRGRPISLSEELVYVLLNKPAGTTLSVPELLPDLQAYNLCAITPLQPASAGIEFLTNDPQVAARLAGRTEAVYRLATQTSLSPTHHTALEATENVNWVQSQLEKEQAYVTLAVRQVSDHKATELLTERGYTITRCDRLSLARLDKKDLPRRFYRFLTEREIRTLRHFS
ncbi:MAG: S4 domain-containing protein [Bacteroidota bacterium]